MKFLQELRHDAPASLVVFFVAVPLCLGIALASGAPLVSGLVAGIVGGVVVGTLSGSHLGVSGPAAGLAVIVLGAIQSLGFEAFLLAVVLAGVIQIAAGALKAGVVAYFFPSSVIRGMLAGIGILIIMKQIPHAFGHDTDPEGDLAFIQPDGETTISAFTSMLADFEVSAIFISVACLAILIVWDKVLVKRSRVFQLIQGPLVAVAFGIACQALASRFAPGWALQQSHLVSVPIAGNFSELAGLLTYPDWSRIADPTIHLTALTLAVVASLETLLCVEATDKLDPSRRITPTNRELVAQGCGNIASGMMGGLPVTQVIVRSSANIQSGGRTKLSAILHGLLLLIAVVALPHVLNLVPLAVLGSILLVVGYKLADPALFRRMYALGPAQFVPFMVTIVGIIATDLLVGIGMGMAVAILILLSRSYQNSHFLHMRDREAPDHHHVISIRLAEEVTFLHKGAIIRALADIPDRSQVTIDSSGSHLVDYDVAEAIAEFEQSAAARDITVQRIPRNPDMQSLAVPRRADEEDVAHAYAK